MESLIIRIPIQTESLNDADVDILTKLRERTCPTDLLVVSEDFLEKYGVTEEYLSKGLDLSVIVFPKGSIPPLSVVRG